MNPYDILSLMFTNHRIFNYITNLLQSKKSSPLQPRPGDVYVLYDLSPNEYIYFRVMEYNPKRSVAIGQEYYINRINRTNLNNYNFDTKFPLCLRKLQVRTVTQNDPFNLVVTRNGMKNKVPFKRHYYRWNGNPINTIEEVYKNYNNSIHRLNLMMYMMNRRQYSEVN